MLHKTSRHTWHRQALVMINKLNMRKLEMSECSLSSFSISKISDNSISINVLETVFFYAQKPQVTQSPLCHRGKAVSRSKQGFKSHIRRVNACKKIMRLMVGALNGRP